MRAAMLLDPYMIINLELTIPKLYKHSDDNSVQGTMHDGCYQASTMMTSASTADTP